jgi:hypothetical protein
MQPPYNHHTTTIQSTKYDILLLSQTTFDDFLILKTFAFQFIVRALRQLSSIMAAHQLLPTIVE